MSFDKHSKLSDILFALENLSGTNQKEELKSVLVSKGLTIDDSATLADMIIKLNTTNLGNAQPCDVIKDKKFTNEGHIAQTGTLDLSGLTPETLSQGTTVNGVTGIMNPVLLEYDSSNINLELPLVFITNRICEYDNMTRLFRFKIKYPGTFCIVFSISGDPQGGDKKFNIYINGRLISTKYVNNDIDNDSSSGSVGNGGFIFSATVDDIIEVSGESYPINNSQKLITTIKPRYSITMAENTNA